MSEEDTFCGYSLKDWHSKEGALKYFEKINSVAELRAALKEELGTHASINAFNHFLMEVLVKHSSDKEFETVIKKLREILSIWFQELRQRLLPQKSKDLELLCAEIHEFLSLAQDVGLSRPKFLLEIVNLVNDLASKLSKENGLYLLKIYNVTMNYLILIDCCFAYEERKKFKLESEMKKL